MAYYRVLMEFDQGGIVRSIDILEFWRRLLLGFVMYAMSVVGKPLKKLLFDIV